MFLLPERRDRQSEMAAPAPRRRPSIRPSCGGGIVAVPAPNSVVYRLARRGGSILSWEAIPSRVVYEPAAAGPIVLVSSASPTVTAIDLRDRKARRPI